MAKTLIVHTTESNPSPRAAGDVAAYLKRENKMSHRVFDPAYNVEAFLLDWDAPERTLKNLSGGVETNNRPGTFQVEIVGWADTTHRQSDTWYFNLAMFLRKCCNETGTPWTFPVPFLSSDYSKRHINRLSNEAWLTVNGIVGHCHVPENQHWDPGLLDVGKLQLYGGADEMATADELVRAFMNFKIRTRIDLTPSDPDGTEATLTVQQIISNAYIELQKQNR